MKQSKSEYGRKLAANMYARRAAKTRNVEVKPQRSNSKAPVLKLYPDIDGVEPMQGIKWELNSDIASTMLNYLVNQQFSLLQMPTGTGKTSTAIRTLALYQEQLRDKLKLVIIAPRAVIDGKGWHRTLKAWNAEHPNNRLEPLMIETPERFANILSHKTTLIETVKLLAPDGVVVIDEAHYYKTPTSKRSKTLLKLKGIRKLGLTATPFTNDAVMDGISYAVQAGLYTSKSAFMRQTGLGMCLDMYGNPRVYLDNGDVDTRVWPFYPTFHDQLSQIVYSPEIQLDSLDMPNVTSKLLQLEFDQVLEERINSIRDASKEGAFESATDVTLALIDTLALSPVRLNALNELVSRKDVRQPLIFYWHNSVRDAIVESLEQAGHKPRLISGGHSVKHVDLDSDQPILVQYQSGSEGIEFKRSNMTVFYQNQSSASCLEQARGRNKRRGMQHDVTQISLVSHVSFDQQLFTRLNRRMDTSQKMLEQIAMNCINNK